MDKIVVVNNLLNKKFTKISNRESIAVKQKWLISAKNASSKTCRVHASASFLNFSEIRVSTVLVVATYLAHLVYFMVDPSSEKG